MSNKKLLLGLGTMFLVQILLGKFFGAVVENQLPFMTLQSGITALLAAFTGGTVARKGFLLPALGLWLVGWAVIAYTLYQIASPVTEDSMSSIIHYNWACFVVSGVATGIGALLGQSLATSRANRRVAT